MLWCFGYTQHRCFCYFRYLHNILEQILIIPSSPSLSEGGPLLGRVLRPRWLRGVSRGLSGPAAGSVAQSGVVPVAADRPACLARPGVRRAGVRICDNAEHRGGPLQRQHVGVHAGVGGIPSIETSGNEIALSEGESLLQVTGDKTAVGTHERSDLSPAGHTTRSSGHRARNRTGTTAIKCGLLPASHTSRNSYGHNGNNSCVNGGNNKCVECNTVDLDHHQLQRPPGGHVEHLHSELNEPAYQPAASCQQHKQSAHQ